VHTQNSGGSAPYSDHTERECHGQPLSAHYCSVSLVSASQRFSRDRTLQRVDKSTPGVGFRDGISIQTNADRAFNSTELLQCLRRYFICVSCTCTARGVEGTTSDGGVTLATTCSWSSAVTSSCASWTACRKLSHRGICETTCTRSMDLVGHAPCCFGFSHA
jgi:hypothetical protein